MENTLVRRGDRTADCTLGNACNEVLAPEAVLTIKMTLKNAEMLEAKNNLINVFPTDYKWSPGRICGHERVAENG